MRVILFSALLVFTSFAKSQVSVTSSQMPSANDTFRYVVTQPLAFQSEIAKTGTNQNWSFNTNNKLILRLDEFKSSSKTPYAFYFFNTVGRKVADTLGLGQFKMEDIYQFYKTRSGSHRIEGIGFKISIAPFPLAGNYSEEDIVFEFPLQYGNRDSNNFKVKINIPLIGSYEQSGHRITEVIGEGKSIVVNDTFETILVKCTLMGHDSVDTQLGEFGFPFHRVEYYWLSPDFNAPLAYIQGNVVLGNFVPIRSEYMNFEPRTGGGGGSTSLEDWELTQNPQAYPNPVANTLHFTQPVASAVLTDMQGRLLLQVKEQVSIDLSNFASGVYLLRLQDAEGRVYLHKVVKK